MKKLLLVRAPGLTAAEACRGDVAWNLSDLIADGSFARLSGAPALDGLGENVTIVDVPFQELPAFDQALGKLRERGLPMAVVSESVFISQHFFREIKPGTTLGAADIPGLLARILA
jgi:hypothetical protein